MVVADLSRGALLVILVAAVGTGVRAEDRKAGEAVNIMWRFDGNGRFPNIHPPSEWRRDRNILWKSPVEVGGYSSPVFVGDRIILSWGCLLALNAKDGRTLWRATDAKPTYGTPAIAKIGGEAVAITPAGDIVRPVNGETSAPGCSRRPTPPP